MKALLAKILLILHCVVAISPFVMICYLFKTWVDNGEVATVQLISALYYWLGIDPTLKHVPAQFLGFYNLYVYLLKLPLLLWLFIVSIPSVIAIHHKLE
jgi:hypothetical protein